MTFDNILLYGGISIAALSAIAALIYLILSKAGMTRLMTRLENEYGKREKKPVSAKNSAGIPKK